MQITMKELSAQYEESINVQKEVIDSYRQRLKTAREKANFKEIKRLNTTLRVLYEEKSELEERAHGLKKYLSLS